MARQPSDGNVFAALAAGSARDLVRAERDIRARIAQQPLDFAAMAAVSNIYRAANVIRNHMERTVLAGEDPSWAAFGDVRAVDLGRGGSCQGDAQLARGRRIRAPLARVSGAASCVNGTVIPVDGSATAVDTGGGRVRPPGQPAARRRPASSSAR